MIRKRLLAISAAVLAVVFSSTPSQAFTESNNRDPYWVEARKRVVSSEGDAEKKRYEEYKARIKYKKIRRSKSKKLKMHEENIDEMSMEDRKKRMKYMQHMSKKNRDKDEAYIERKREEHKRRMQRLDDENSAKRKEFIRKRNEQKNN